MLDHSALRYDPATMAPVGCLPNDMNEDGRMDLLVYYWGRTPVAFLNQGGTPKTAQTLTAADYRPKGCRDPSVVEEPMLDFTSGYVKRALDQLPRQGSQRPWKLYRNYLLDLMTLRFGKVNDGTMAFGRSK